jgi:HEPN domain-containing protein
VAEDLLGAEAFEWSCFVEQQAAGKGIKAVLQRLNASAWGHSIFELMRIISNKVEVKFCNGILA